MPTERSELDHLDVLLIKALTEHPRAGHLELSRLTGVSRATVQARIGRLESAGVVTGYGPDIDLEAAGYPLLAFVSLEIAQGRLEEVAGELAAIPEVLEAYGTTGVSDVFCRVAAASHDSLQQILLRINRIRAVVRSTSVVALSTVVPPRHVPLLESERRRRPSRVPGLRQRPTA